MPATEFKRIDLKQLFPEGISEVESKVARVEGHLFTAQEFNRELKKAGGSPLLAMHAAVVAAQSLRKSLLRVDGRLSFNKDSKKALIDFKELAEVFDTKYALSFISSIPVQSDIHQALKPLEDELLKLNALFAKKPVESFATDFQIRIKLIEQKLEGFTEFVDQYLKEEKAKL